MKKRNVFLGVLIAIVVTIALIEGAVYFAKFQEDTVLYITIIIHNVFSLFLFDPGINIENAADFLSVNPSTHMAVLTCFYGAAVLTAQLFTATVILQAFWFGARRFFAGLPMAFRENIIIVGYNDKVEMLLANRRKDKEQRKLFVRLVTEQDMPKEREQSLLKEGVLVYRVNNAAESQKDVDKLIRQIGLKRAQRVILFEEDALKNVSWFIKLNSKEKYIGKAKYYIYSTSEEMEQLLTKTQDARLKAALEKQKKIKREEDRDIEIQVADYYFFDINELKVLDLFSTEGTMLHTYNLQMTGEEEKLGLYDLHLLIVGFGGLGQQALVHAMNMGVFDANSRVLVDVLDRQVFEEKAMFENRFNADYVEISDNEISIPRGEKCDGSLTVRFHEMNIRKGFFKEKLIEIDEEMPLTYVTVCLGNPEAAMHCAIEVEQYLHRAENLDGKRIPVAVRLEVDDFTMREVAENTDFFNEIRVMKTDEDVINLDVICDVVKEEACRDFNKTYNAISSAVWAAGDMDYLSVIMMVKDVEGCEDDWDKKDYYKKRSNRRLYTHQKVKAWRSEGKDIYADKAFLEDMAMLEHRRWNYFTASEGWGHTAGDKDQGRKLTPFLVNWEILKEKHHSVCAYDLIAFVLLQQKNKK